MSSEATTRKPRRRPTIPPGDVFLEGLLAHTGYSAHTVYDFTSGKDAGAGFPFRKVKGWLVFTLAEVDAWLASRGEAPVADNGTETGQIGMGAAVGVEA